MKRLLFILFVAQWAFAQGYDTPLTMQGIDHNTIQSAASKALGGTSLLLQNEPAMMFLNPATLQSLKGIQVSIGGVQNFEKSSQVQQYSPLKYYANFSLLMEGLTGSIPNPDTSFVARNAGDTVQRPFDQIGPNWSRTKNKTLPVEAVLAIPFSLGEQKFSAGFGAVEYANLNHYYENHNVLNPSIGSERPFPVPLPGSDNDTSVFRTQWSSYMRSRDGVIRGYGVALSGAVTERLSLGVSGMLLKGSTDDYEQRILRGNLVFYRNWFRIDSIYGNSRSTGTSDYKGQEFTLSGIYRGKNVTFGVSVKPPTTITRTYATQVVSDTGSSPRAAAVSGEDKITLPWRGVGGISIALRENLLVGLEYEIRSYASATYRAANGTETNPWSSSSILHAGAQYSPLPWLDLRAGVRGQSETFEPDGNPMVGDPVSTTVYSAGCGIAFGNIHLNLAYEYGLMEYQDLYQTNVNFNTTRRHSILADVSYDIAHLWQQ